MTGQTAFTGTWFLSLLAVALGTPAKEYIDGEGVLIIAAVHVFYFLGSIGHYLTFRRNAPSSQSANPMSPDMRAALMRVFILCAGAGIYGSFSLAQTSGALDAIRNGSLVIMRASVLNGEIQFSVFERLLSNFIYPAALLGTLLFVLRPKKIGNLFFILIPIVGMLLFSLSNGGRGTVLIGGLMMAWGVAINRTAEPLQKRNSSLMPGLFIFACTAGYSNYIVNTRGYSPENTASIYNYFSGPIPAFCEFVKRFSPFSLFSVDISQFAICREIFRLLGYMTERTIDSNVVFIPHAFNVFTFIAEQLQAFGYLGTVAYALCLGVCASILESRTPSIYVLGCRILLYTYLTYGLFTDLSFFIVGWWLALFMLLVVIPLTRIVFSTKQAF